MSQGGYVMGMGPADGDSRCELMGLQMGVPQVAPDTSIKQIFAIW